VDIAGSEMTISVGETRIVLDRNEKLTRNIVEPSAEEQHAPDDPINLNPLE
jgi:hypothetical protein